MDPKLKDSVWRLARKEKEKVFCVELAGVKMDDSYGSIAFLEKAKWFVDKIKKHNADVDSIHDNGLHTRHLQQGTSIVIGKEVDEATKVIHLNISTQHMLLNIFRSINSACELMIAGERIYSLCRNEFEMIIFCTTGLHAETFPLCYSIVPKESEPSYVQTWKGFTAAAFYFITRYKICLKNGCKLCAEARACREHREYDDFRKSARPFPTCCHAGIILFSASSKERLRF